MKTFGSINLGGSSRVWINAGYNLHRFALGFSIDRYGLSLDLAWFWFSIEF